MGKALSYVPTDFYPNGQDILNDINGLECLSFILRDIETEFASLDPSFSFLTYLCLNVFSKAYTY